MIIGDFVGTLKAYQLAEDRGSTDIEGKNLPVAGIVSVWLVAQTNAADPNGDSCSHAECQSMQGAGWGVR
jgi:hypothetical protein